MQCNHTKACKHEDDHFLIKKTKQLTFDINLSRGVVCSETVGGHAGVASGVVLEGFTDHQCVQDTISADLYVRRVVQLSTFTEPPGRGGESQFCYFNMSDFDWAKVLNWQLSRHSMLATVSGLSILCMWQQFCCIVNMLDFKKSLAKWDFFCITILTAIYDAQFLSKHNIHSQFLSSFISPPLPPLTSHKNVIHSNLLKINL